MPIIFSSVKSLEDVESFDPKETYVLQIPEHVKSSGPAIQQEMVELNTLLETNPRISALNLSKNNLGSNELGILGSVGAVNTNLKTLILSENNIDADSELGGVISKFPNMSYLDLKYNNISDVGAERLSNIIVGNNIDLLDLSYNNINLLGAKAIRDEIGGAIYGSEKAPFEVKLAGNPVCNLEQEGSASVIRDLCGDDDNPRPQISQFRKTVNDAIMDYGRSILIPQIVPSQDPELLRSIVSSNGSFQGREASVESLEWILEVTRRELFSGCTRKQITSFSNSWHSALSQEKTLKLKDYNGTSWESLFSRSKEDICKEVLIADHPNLQGWRFVSLTTPDELKNEGKRLKHCVGGYSGKCIANNAHIVSVVNPEGISVSTIEFSVDSDARTCKNEQHYGYDNKDPLPKEKEAVQWLRDSISSGIISINYDFLKESKHERYNTETASLSEKMMLKIGFDPRDTKKVSKIKKIYKEILPDNEQMRQNFDKFKDLNEIVIDPREALLKFKHLGIDAGGGSFPLSKPVAEEMHKKEKPPEGKILETIQARLDELFGEGCVSANIRNMEEDMKLSSVESQLSVKRNKHARVEITVIKNVGISEVNNALNTIFAGNVEQIEGQQSLRINKFAPKPVMDLLSHRVAGLPSTSVLSGDGKKVINTDRILTTQL